MNFGKTIFAQLMDFLPEVRISKMCLKVPRPLQNKKFLLLGSISLPGFCPIDLSGKPSRYRKPAKEWPNPNYITWAFEARSHAILWPTPIKSEIGVFMPISLKCSSTSCDLFMRQRRFRPRIGSNGLRSGFHDHRFVSIPFPMGEVPKTKRGCKIAYPPGFTREYSYRNLNYSRKSPRHTNA